MPYFNCGWLKYPSRSSKIPIPQEIKEGTILKIFSLSNLTTEMNAIRRNEEKVFSLNFTYFEN